MATSRATVYQRVQLGIQTVQGTLVPATHIIPAIDLTAVANRPIKTNRYPGTKGVISTQHGQEHMTARWTSALDFNIMSYIFSSMFGTLSPALTGTKTQTWAWTPDATDALSPLFFTIEQGGVKGAEKFGDVVFDGFTLRFNKEDASMEGTMFGSAFLRQITMTPSLPEVAPVPVHPAAIGVFISTDNGTTYTQLNDVLDGELSFSGLWEPSFRVSDLNVSYKKATEKQPEFGGSLTVEVGTESNNFISQLYSGQQIWIGIKALGPLIETIAGSPATNNYHMLRFNEPVYVTRDEPGDKSNVWGTSIRFEGAHNILGMADISVVNKVASL